MRIILLPTWRRSIPDLSRLGFFFTPPHLSCRDRFLRSVRQGDVLHTQSTLWKEDHGVLPLSSVQVAIAEPVECLQNEAGNRARCSYCSGCGGEYEHRHGKRGGWFLSSVGNRFAGSLAGPERLSVKVHSLFLGLRDRPVSVTILCWRTSRARCGAVLRTVFLPKIY